MVQKTPVVPSTGIPGSELRQTITDIGLAQMNLHRGTVRPDYATAGTMYLVDGADSYSLRVWDGTDEIPMATIRTNTNETIYTCNTIQEKTGGVGVNVDGVLLKDGFARVAVTADPVGPPNGAIWVNTTTNKLFTRINGASQEVLIGGSGSQQLAKAWVNFNGTGTIAIRSSFGVSSITDLGVGQYRVNFSTAFADANYCAICGIDGFGGSTSEGGHIVTNYTTTSCEINVRNAGGTNFDTTNVCLAVFAA